jgi:hypothetical protein
MNLLLSLILLVAPVKSDDALDSLYAASKAADATLAVAVGDENTKANAHSDATQMRQKAQVAADAAAKAFADEWAKRHEPIPTPVPPDPKPPKPPEPQPPAPIPSGTLRVLFLYDPMQFALLPPAQQRILGDPALRAYLNAHCPLECPTGACPLNVAGKSPSYLFLPDSADVSGLNPVWQKTIAAAGKVQVPWLYVVDSKGAVIVNQPWPSTVDETIELLKKYGGP